MSGLGRCAGSQGRQSTRCTSRPTPLPREWDCPFGEVVRQDQDVPVPRWGIFHRPMNVHANTLQRVSRSHGLHWRTVVLGRALPPLALRARAAPCVYVTTHPGPVESAPDSCQRPALSQGSRHQLLLNPFLGRESAAMSPDEAIFIHPTAPLLPQHVHVAATLRGTFHLPARANQPLPQ
ncbi:conserved hypothetical protein [Trichinella spiralis]|uniref:hypothetical protein n=1 Tax=Trichinella spiralis TaxID=6334 RepID=UPI0001EFD7F6|nr:conserved hypothetical protein [Trichinella spiralis]